MRNIENSEQNQCWRLRLPASATEVWNSVTNRMIRNLGDEGPYLATLLANVVLYDTSSGINANPCGRCMNQGPYNPSIVMIGRVDDMLGVFELIDALSDAVFFYHNPYTLEPSQAAREAGRHIFDDASGENILIEGNYVSSDWLLCLMAGYVNTNDLVESADAFVIKNSSVRRLRLSECGYELQEAVNNLRNIGKIALTGLSLGQLDISPQKWIKKECQLQISKKDTNRLTGFDRFSAIGAVIQLLATSKYHSQFQLSFYLPLEILPALNANQARFYLDTNGKPVGMVTWGRLTERSLYEIENSGRSIQRSEWDQGEELFFNDMILNGANIRMIFYDLKQYFPDTVASSLRRQQNRMARRKNNWRRGLRK